MSPRTRLALVLLVGVAQLAVPAWMIAGRELVLRHGTVWRFRSAPIDPADPFRGRYVALSFEQRSVPVPEGLEIARGDRVYVPLSEGADGFAELGAARREPPEDGDFLRLRVHRSFTDEDGSRRGRVALPFDRLYLEESIAPRAEELFRALRRTDETVPAWAVVRVHDGRAVLEDVMVDGRPLGKLAREAAEREARDAPGSDAPGAAAP